MTAALPSLRRNILYATFGNGVFLLSQWAIITVVAKLGTPEEVGALTLATAVVMPVFLMVHLRDGHAVDDLDYFKRADYVALRLLSSATAFLFIAVVVATYQERSGWLVQSATLALALVKIVGAQSDMNHGVFQRAERMDFVALSLLARAILGAGTFALVYWATRDLPLALMAEAAAWWLGVQLLDRRFLVRLDARTPLAAILAARPRTVLRLLWWMLPLGISVFLMSAAMSAPRLVLERYVDLASVGVFGAIAYISAALATFASALGRSAAARLRRLYRTGARRRFVRLGLRLTVLSGGAGGCLVLIAWIAGEPLLTLLYGDAYRRGDLLVIVVLAAALRISAAPLQFALMAGQAFRRWLANSAATFAVGLGTALLLIPPYGATGAAWTLVATTACNLSLTVLAFGIVAARIDAPPTSTPATSAGRNSETVS